MRKYLTIFVHIPKTAGSTIRTLLAQNYLTSEMRAFGGQAENFDRFAQYIKNNINSFSLLHGHFAFGLGSFSKRPVKNFTILRNPVRRFFSDYFFATYYKDHNLHDKIKSGELSIEDYAGLGERNPYFDNLMTKYLAGLDAGGIYRRPTRDDLELAKSNLQQGIIAFGITERFDESALLFARELQWEKPFYMNKNISEKSINDVSRKALDVAEPWLVLDRELYEFASDLFSQRVQSLGSEFATALAAFRRVEARIHEDYEASRHRIFVTNQPVDSVLRRANRRMPAACLERLLYPRDYNVVRDFVSA